MPHCTAHDTFTRLLSRLHRVFDKDPAAEIALRIRYGDSRLTWRVADETLTTVVTDHPAAALTLPLGDHTLTSLAATIDAAPGYSVLDLTSNNPSRSALCLIPATGDTAQSNGDALWCFISLLWAILVPIARTLAQACAAIPEAIEQIHLHQAAGEFIDLHGGDYYGIRRTADETDADYLARIIATILIPRSNNVAIQQALTRALGLSEQDVRILDADRTDYGVVLRLDGSWALDETYSLNGRTIPGELGLNRAQFDLVINGRLSVTDAQLLPIINQFKAAGTRLRNIYRAWPLVLDGTWRLDGNQTLDGTLS
jgi:hypothetical protein